MRKKLVQFCGITQHVIMFSCSAKLLKYFANSRAKHVADLRSEILVVALIILTAVLLVAVPVFAQDDASTGVVTGRIVNRSPDGRVPEGLELMLHAWDENFDERLMLDGFSESDGTFAFTDVSLDPNLQYAVMLTYGGAVYASEPVSVIDGKTELSVEIPIYESTADASSVRIQRQHVLFDAALNGLRVAEIYILSNSGGRTITSQADKEDAMLSPLQFPLPEGATDVSFNEGADDGRFLLAPGGFVDMAPLRPGAGTSQVIVSYILPYEDNLTYSWTAPWPVENLSYMLASDIGLSLEGENLSPLGTQAMGGGGQVEVFGHSALEQGERVDVSLSGTLLRPLLAPTGEMAPEAGTDTGSSSKKVLAIGGTAVGLALAAVGVWWFRRPESEELEDSKEEADDSFDSLVTQIALLDAAHDQGEVGNADYSRQRAQLVRQARALLAPTS